MQLLSNATAITKNISVPFQAIGGVEPYTYSIVSGGIGSINASTGLYTAPSDTYGRATIRVTDDEGDEEEKIIKVLHPLALLADIIETEMSLPNGSVWLFDQKINMPNDDRLFVVIQEMGNKAFGNHNSLNNDGTSHQYISMLSMIQIDVISKSLESMYRKEEVLMALKSDYAQRQQQLNGFLLSTISTSFVNISNLDGTAIPYRYNITIQMQYTMRKSKATEYFSEFPDVEVISDVGQTYVRIDAGYLLMEDGENIEL